MKNKVHLVMPMAGKGSRFQKEGFDLPKPLITIQGFPFLYWSTLCIAKFVDIKDITFVVLKEHIDNFKMDEEIKRYFKDAKIVVLEEVLNGAVLTCMEGVKHISDEDPILFNDCDHIFYCDEFYQYCNKGNFDNMDGALLTFTSVDPKFSFLKLNEEENVIETKEKEAISDKAICGCYYFRNKDIFLTNAKQYLEKCNYNEYFVSGVYNVMIENKHIIKNFTVDNHVPFGTPEEYEIAKDAKELQRILEK